MQLFDAVRGNLCIQSSTGVEICQYCGGQSKLSEKGE